MVVIWKVEGPIRPKRPRRPVTDPVSVRNYHRSDTHPVKPDRCRERMHPPTASNRCRRMVTMRCMRVIRPRPMGRAIHLVSGIDVTGSDPQPIVSLTGSMSIQTRTFSPITTNSNRPLSSERPTSHAHGVHQRHSSHTAPLITTRTESLIISTFFLFSIEVWGGHLSLRSSSSSSLAAPGRKAIVSTRDRAKKR